MKFSGFFQIIPRFDCLRCSSFADKPDFNLAGLGDIILPSSRNGLVEENLVCFDVNLDPGDDILLLNLEGDYRSIRVLGWIGWRSRTR